MLTVSKLKSPVYKRPISRLSSNSSGEATYIKAIVRCR